MTGSISTGCVGMMLLAKEMRRAASAVPRSGSLEAAALPPAAPPPARCGAPL
ncbi:hypothetical protein [Pandoraea cepalis]|uniref:hypothetical protein n=1 Tax=Pandoraea cepalis TaxID=2508294 RepID=UPI00263B2363|nr:hypothetical protein [Pandoraea cepalis]